jgi:hypothetical protein
MHSIFSKYKRTLAHEEVSSELGGGDINFLGVHIPQDVDARRNSKEYWSGRSAVHFQDDKSMPDPTHEDYYEYLDLLEAIDNGPRNQFIMVEVGAGYGRWMLNAAHALSRHRFKRYTSFHLIGFEADNERSKMLVKLMQINKIENFKLICKVVVSPDVYMQGENINFAINKNDASKFGGMIIDPVLEVASGRPQMTDTDWMKIEKLPVCNMAEELSDFEVIDFMNFDIQNAEISVIPAYIDFLTQRVKMVHVGTHSKMADETVAKSFLSSGWIPRWQFPWRSTISNEYGQVNFRDGIQSFENPRV